MKAKRGLALLLITLSLITIGSAQNNKPITDYLNVPGPINFEKVTYNLSWSSHPMENLYQQEFIVTGDNPDKYKAMILIDVITGKGKIKDVVATKIAEIKKLKETNPVVNYEMFENKGEYMIDFILSVNTPDGKLVSTVERNVYRYKSVTDKSGQKLIVLFAASVRSYGDDIDNFFAQLKTNRDDLINAVGKFNIPDITVAR